MKSLLDGHILLSRSVAEQGIYPAIDATRSLSRFAPMLWSDSDRKAAERATQLFGAYEASRIMIEAGVYVRGSNQDTDQAIDQRPALQRFLRQGASERFSRDETRRALATALSGGAL